MPRPPASSVIACSTSTCAESTRMATSGNSSRIVRGRVEPFDGLRRRHPDVDQHDVRDQLPDEVEEVAGVACLADHLEARARQEARQPSPEQDVVIGDDHAQRALCRGIDVESAS